MKKLIFLKKFNGKDLTKIIYPIIIFLTGWYIVANAYRLFTGWPLYMIPYIIIWALLPMGFAYLAIKGVKLKFRWSVLSVIGIILVVAFVLSVCLEIASPYFNLSNFFLTGQWDHFFFPIAFGLLFLCDLRKLPRRFWAMLVPFAFFCLPANLSLISNVFFDNVLIDIEGVEGPPGFFVFFGVRSWAEFSTVTWEYIVRGLAFYLREQLTFFTTLPIVILYYLLKSFSFIF